MTVSNCTASTDAIEPTNNDAERCAELLAELWRRCPDLRCSAMFRNKEGSWQPTTTGWMDIQYEAEAALPGKCENYAINVGGAGFLFVDYDGYAGKAAGGVRPEHVLEHLRTLTANATMAHVNESTPGSGKHHAALRLQETPPRERNGSDVDGRATSTATDWGSRLHQKDGLTYECEDGAVLKFDIRSGPFKRDGSYSGAFIRHDARRLEFLLAALDDDGWPMLEHPERLAGLAQAPIGTHHPLMSKVARMVNSLTPPPENKDDPRLVELVDELARHTLENLPPESGERTFDGLVAEITRMLPKSISSNLAYLEGRNAKAPIELVAAKFAQVATSASGARYVCVEELENLERGEIFLREYGAGSVDGMLAELGWTEKQLRAHPAHAVYKGQQPAGDGDPVDDGMLRVPIRLPAGGRAVKPTNDFETHLRDRLFRDYPDEIQNTALDFFADIVQRPTESPPGIGMLLTHEATGTGKSSLGEQIMARILGPLLYMNVGCMEEILGQFAYKLAHKALVSGDDITWSGQRQIADKLKSRVTIRRVSLGRKFHDGYDVLNTIRYMFTTNQGIPAYIELSDRRWFVLRVPPPEHVDWKDKAERAAYWKPIMDHLLEPSTIDGMRLWLLKRKVDIDRLRIAPDTNEKREAQMAMSPALNVLLDAVSSGCLPAPATADGACTSTALAKAIGCAPGRIHSELRKVLPEHLLPEVHEREKALDYKRGWRFAAPVALYKAVSHLVPAGHQITPAEKWRAVTVEDGRSPTARIADDVEF